jgi:hypothetical protein
MIKQIPAERPLPDQQRILERVLADTGKVSGRNRWLLPVAAAASIAVVAGGALTVPSMLRSDEPGTPAGTSTATTATATSKPGEKTVSIDQGNLTAAQATAFGTECVKWVGSKDRPGQTYGDAPLDWPGAGAKAEKILHATKIAGRTAGTTDWTVAVKSGSVTYACVGRMTTKGEHGKLMRDYDFGTFSTKYPDGLGGAGDGGGLVTDLKGREPAKLSTNRWVVAPPTATKVQRRFVLKGRPGPWFSSDVVDGLGYISARAEARLVPGDKVRIETRLWDDAGKQVGKLLVEAMSVAPPDPSRPGITLQPDGIPPR